MKGHNISDILQILLAVSMGQVKSSRRVSCQKSEIDAKRNQTSDLKESTAHTLKKDEDSDRKHANMIVEENLQDLYRKPNMALQLLVKKEVSIRPDPDG